MCNLSDNIYDYYNVSQGKVTIPNMDDGEEFALTDVSVFIFTMFRMVCNDHRGRSFFTFFFGFCYLFSITQLNVDKKILDIFYPSDYIRVHLYSIFIPYRYHSKNERKIPDLCSKKTLYETDHFLHEKKLFFLD